MLKEKKYLITVFFLMPILFKQSIKHMYGFIKPWEVKYENAIFKSGLNKFLDRGGYKVSIKFEYFKSGVNIQLNILLSIVNHK